ncbi:MAG: NUDIX domain-containing protein [Bacteroidota bacterium]
MTATGVIIARFQTPYLHDGHIELINNVKSKHNRTIIVLGVSRITGSRKNPYDYYTREKLIKSAYKDLLILPLSDHPSDPVWTSNLDDLLNNTFPGSDFLLYGSRDSFIPYYNGKYETIELPEHGDYNATELRKKYADKVFESKDFRAGILYAVHNQYKKVYPTVDIAVFKNNKREILLGKKAINNKWRLIGGFVDPEDEGFEKAAQRELAEEAGPIETTPLTYETSAKIDDWRYRNEADKIITTLYSCDYISGVHKAQDDIIDLEWFEVEALSGMIKEHKISEEHIGLFELLIKKYDKN